jgi:hypothetical protein
VEATAAVAEAAACGPQSKASSDFDRTEIMNEKKSIIERLHLCMIAELQPHLQSLGFKFVGKPSRSRFKPLWIRDRGQSLDAIEFQWDKYNDPKFVIFFRSFDDDADLAKCRDDPKLIGAWNFGAIYYGRPKSNAWFKPKFLLTLLGFSESEIIRVVSKTKKSIDEISDFLLGGPASDSMEDSELWLDERLPDSPPPWDEYGKLGSMYHLPPRRVGEGKKRTVW